MISKASSIFFRKEDGLLPSFDNTFHNDLTLHGGMSLSYAQKVYSDDVVTIQIKVITGYTVDLYFSENCWGAWQKYSSGTKEVVLTGYDIWEIEIDFADFSSETIQFELRILDTTPTIAEYWHSEAIEILTDEDDSHLLIEFFNLESAFEVDYSNEITHQLRIEGQLKEYKPGGESSVFDNQNEVTKIKDEVKRVLTFKTEPIPAYLAEMLRVAVAEDKFFINEVEFVAEAVPEFDNNASNLGMFSVALTQRNVIGVNTHDIGFDCDTITNTDTMVLQELAASGQKSFAITDDYLVLTLTGYRTAGSPTIKAGITPGGDEILSSMVLSPSYLTEVALIPTDKASITGGTLYVTVTGAGATANIYIICIKNRQ